MAAMTLQTALVVTFFVGFIDCDTVTPQQCKLVMIDNKVRCLYDSEQLSIMTASGSVEANYAKCEADGGMIVDNLCVFIKKAPVVESKPGPDTQQAYPDDVVIVPMATYNKSSDNGFKPLTTSENYYVQSVCGQSTKIRSRIMHGKVAAKGQFPWALNFKNGCSAVLISPRHALTAQHCVSSKKPNALYGVCPPNEANINARMYYGGVCSFNDSYCPNGGDVKTATINRFIYPRDDIRDNYCLTGNDIAVVLLNEDIEFNDYVKPICLSKLVPDNLVNVMNVGFGYKGKDPSLKSMSQLRYMESFIFKVPNFLEIMTRGIENGTMTAGVVNGDSGGPVQASFNGSSRTYLAGIHSRGVLYTPDGWELSTYVPAFADWLCTLTGVCELQ